MVLHEVAGDESACSTETGLAVDGNSTLCTLAYVEEGIEDRVGWRTPVVEEEIVVVESGSGEPLASVELLVEANDGCDSMTGEVIEVVLGCVEGVAIFEHMSLVRTGKGDELARDNPVQVAVLHPLETEKNGMSEMTESPRRSGKLMGAGVGWGGGRWIF